MDALTIRVADFEGPLDLLLHLIKELKIDIDDIPMVELTNQYLAYIHSMQEVELELASDYLLMAATLLEIKARTLLPKPPVDEVEVEEYVEDPREELVQKLMEYKEIQENAKQLEALNLERSQHYGKEASDLTLLQERIPLQEGQLTTQDLWNALKKIALRQTAKMPLQANLQHETHSVEEIMKSILDRFEVLNQKRISFESCFPDMNRHAIVTTFLAMLQLVREQQVRLIQHVPYEEIYLERQEGGELPRD